MKTSEAIWHVLNNIPGYTVPIKKAEAAKEKFYKLEDYPFIDQQVVCAKSGLKEGELVVVVIDAEADNLALDLGFPPWGDEAFWGPNSISAISITQFEDILKNFITFNNPRELNKANEIIAHWETAAYYCESIGD